jgi:hypothetical protein
MQLTKCQRNLDAFHSLSSSKSQVLRSVHERELDGCIDRLVLVFSDKLLAFQVDEDDDTLSVQVRDAVTPNGKFARIRAGFWPQLVGKAFGWGWVTVNQQGYCDGALLSFDGIVPNVSLGVVASSIKTSVLLPQTTIKSKRSKSASG